jgi:hypothetical protein
MRFERMELCFGQCEKILRKRRRKEISSLEAALPRKWSFAYDEVEIFRVGINLKPRTELEVSDWACYFESSRFGPEPGLDLHLR